ncbi:carboxylesterase family protein, partial [Candidatus Sumerlaeota bacterium]|nr:carboxylesterase family protein [Candidatus Sumerlaeota bacterium]
AQADRDIAEAMIGHWVQFAETGNPNREGLLEWPAYEPGSDLHMEFGDAIQIGSALRKEACELLDRILAAGSGDAGAK